VSCESERIVSCTGYALLNDDEAVLEGMVTDELEGASDMPHVPELPFGLFCIPIVLAGGIVSLASVRLRVRPGPMVLRAGLGACIVGIMVALSAGCYYGVKGEQLLNLALLGGATDDAGPPAMADEAEDSAEDFARSVALLVDLRMDMDAGYYLTLAAFSLGIGGLAVPALLRLQDRAKALVASSVVGGFAALSMSVCLAIAAVCFARPATCSSMAEFDAMVQLSPTLLPPAEWAHAESIGLHLALAAPHCPSTGGRTVRPYVNRRGGALCPMASLKSVGLTAEADG
jgi:hypothetical protein